MSRVAIYHKETAKRQSGERERESSNRYFTRVPPWCRTPQRFDRNTAAMLWFYSTVMFFCNPFPYVTTGTNGAIPCNLAITHTLLQECWYKKRAERK